MQRYANFLISPNLLRTICEKSSFLPVFLRFERLLRTNSVILYPNELRTIVREFLHVTRTNDLNDRTFSDGLTAFFGGLLCCTVYVIQFI